jgi:hypothetical protein
MYLKSVTIFGEVYKYSISLCDLKIVFFKEEGILLRCFWLSL